MKRTPIRPGRGMRMGLLPHGLPLKRSPIPKMGRISLERRKRRQEWIEDHPPISINGGTYLYYNCHICVYFEEEELVSRVEFRAFVLDHVEAKAHLTFDESQKDSNLAPAHYICNSEKGSQKLWQMEKSPMTGKPNPHVKKSL